MHRPAIPLHRRPASAAIANNLCSARGTLDSAPTRGRRTRYCGGPAPADARVMSRPPWKLSQPIETPGWPGSTTPQRTKCVPCSTNSSRRACVFEVIAIAEQDQAIGLLAVLVFHVPVARQLLEGNQQVVALQRAGAGQRAEHGQEERIDQRIVERRIFEKQQRQRAGLLVAQVRGVLVDFVVELGRRSAGCAGASAR